MKGGGWTTEQSKKIANAIEDDKEFKERNEGKE